MRWSGGGGERKGEMEGVKGSGSGFGFGFGEHPRLQCDSVMSQIVHL